MKRFAVIVAGGTGTRMNRDAPKQFLLLARKPVLMHSIKKFNECNSEVVVVLPADFFDEWKILCDKFNFNVQHHLVAGGVTRSESVFKGLQKISLNEGVVAVHDAARPSVSVQLIEKLFNVAEDKGNAVPAIKISDSIRRVTASRNEAANRDEYFLIQTPQCFHLRKLIEAYNSAGKQTFTDDATLFEYAGNTINLVEGEQNNFKITIADDLKMAEAIIKN